MDAENRIINVNIEDEMKTAYIDYSMSVIVSRALPDVRDGLKPVHRRVLYGMHDLGVAYNRPHKKSARIVGEVLGKYHPHGDSSVYDTMVRMAQNWSLRYPLVDGQGNFGSVDGDSPAAMRYTEARLQRLSDELLNDLDKETVDYSLNFDDTLQEPTVLPSKFPNLLVNGSSGIAVGMATNMMPHNLSEVIDGTIAYIDNEEITVSDLLQYVKAPDFPTGGIIYGMSGVIEAFKTGRGRVVVRGKAEIEENESGRNRIIVTEIPFQINKSTLIQKTAELINDKKIEGISDIRDESDREGMRIVYDLKRDAIPNVVLNQLYNYTYLQTSYGINNICLVNGRPRQLNLRELIKYFVEFRHEVVVRRTEYELREAEQKAHILEGLLIALDNLDAVITLIRNSKTPVEAREGLMTNFSLSEVQAKAILELRLQKLTGLERDSIRAEYEELMKRIGALKEILAHKELRMNIIKEELLDVKERYGDVRRTEISFEEGEISIEDLIPNEQVVITISHLGYVKRTPLAEFKEQNRGGKGSKGGSTRDDDFIEQILVASNHNTIILFTQKGKCFWLKAYQIPEGSRTSKGRAIQNMINLPGDDKVLAYINIENLNDEEFVKNHYLVFCTKQGVIKKTSLEDYSRPRQNGINAIIIREDDDLLECKLTDGNNEILIASSMGKTIRFNETAVRPMGRNSAGVRGITLDEKNKDVAVGMICIPQEMRDILTVLVVSEKGYGKRSELEEYRITNRGGKGVKTMNITEKTGRLITIKDVNDEYGLMIINKSGLTIRMAVDSISVLGRATQGVRLIKLNEGDEIASIAKIIVNEEEAEDENASPENEASNNSVETSDTTPEKD
ncbi:MAG: DNA gyrase subunit A [Chitinophagales bacterium]|nr:DNA gyrase subunit A [Bacteroidota bacterium]MCB9044073.1 DNA gyrase subunit A [Chitinophagales bacterium]